MSDLGNKQIFARNLQYYMDLFGVTRRDICDQLNLKYTTICDWVTGKKYPRIDKIEMLANYFGVTKADLIEAKDSTSQRDDLFRKILSLDDDDLARINDYIDLLRLRGQKHSD